MMVSGVRLLLMFAQARFSITFFSLMVSIVAIAAPVAVLMVVVVAVAVVVVVAPVMVAWLARCRIHRDNGRFDIGRGVRLHNGHVIVITSRYHQLVRLRFGRSIGARGVRRADARIVVVHIAHATADFIVIEYRNRHDRIDFLQRAQRHVTDQCCDACRIVENGRSGRGARRTVVE